MIYYKHIIFCYLLAHLIILLEAYLLRLFCAMEIIVIY